MNRKVSTNEKSSLSDLLSRAMGSFRTADLKTAKKLCMDIVRIKPDHLDALQLLAVIQSKLGSPQEALATIDRALAVKVNDPELLNKRGIILQVLQRPAEALASYDKALKTKANAEVFYNRATALQTLQRLDEALINYDKALSINPCYLEAIYNRGVVFQELNRFEEALKCYKNAITIKPTHIKALNNQGSIFKSLKRFEEALETYDKILMIDPAFVEALYNRGVILQELKRYDEALSAYDKALSLKAGNARALNNRGVVLQDLKRFQEALESYDKALAIDGEYVDALINRGNVLRDMMRFDEAVVCYEKVLTINPKESAAFSTLADSALRMCDWDRTAEIDERIKLNIEAAASALSPFTMLGYSEDAKLQLMCAKSFARNFVENRLAHVPRPFWNGVIYRHEKIRIAYLSADFKRHATAYLMAGLFELHDRARFEIIGVSFGGDDKSDLRSRLEKSFDRFHDVRFESDQDIARLVREQQVDIAIDLKGYTQDSRPAILGYRPAPIQINYLGFPMTMGADFIDYVIGDKIVTPFDQQKFFTEKIIQLPECYQVNDLKREIGKSPTTRRDAGLPNKGFVFCCFNNNYKITAAVFDVWMRLLASVESSVLWLLRDNESAELNLRKEAAARGIDPARLIFAGRMPLEQHLARHCLADLFLDTLPCNAHTTASDALWTGLPMVTCQGVSFAGRVGASLLCAIGLSELVTRSLDEYESLCLTLATDKVRLRSVRDKLEQNRKTHSLFDTERFRRHIEVAYTTAWDIWQRGERPRSFSVPAV